MSTVELNAKDVMNLRNKTGLPMMACKAALIEAGGDPEKAEDILRKQLKGKMESRTDRAAGQGRLGIVLNADKSAGAIVEVRAETDFTAKNDTFIAMVDKVAQLALKAGAGNVSETPEMKAAIDEIRISTNENCSFARAFKFEGKPGSIASYLHHDGKTGSIVASDGTVSQELLRDVCMHAVAADPRPQGLVAEEIPSDIVEKERKFRLEQAMESGKPKEIAEKMVEGGMRKFFEERALIEQPFVKDPTKKIKDVVGGDKKLSGFKRWAVGEA
jgi:elongation factor Ts